MARLFVSVALCIGAFFVFLFVFQRNLIYFPARFPAYDPAYLEEHDLSLRRAEDLAWLYSPPRPEATGRQAVIVLFHGNGGAAINRLSKARLFNDAGYHVVLAEYPGYATNPGRPSEQAFYAAGRRIIEKTKEEFPAYDIILYGESIGSGTAVQMALEYDIAALVIEAGFSSLTEVARITYPYLPVALLLLDRYDSLGKIHAIRAPLIQIHGRRDRVVPFHIGKDLFDRAPDDKIMIVLDDAGHNNIYEFLSFSRLIGALSSL